MTLMIKKITKVFAIAAALVSMGFAASAKNPVMNYWNSNNGMTGGYVEGNILYGDMDDVKTGYGVAGSADVDWNFSEVYGAQFAIGRDWGKLRFDMRFVGMYGDLDKIGTQSVYRTRGADCTSADFEGDGAGSCQPDNYGAFGHGTFNLAWDIYRFDLHRFSDNSTWAWNAAVTPFIGGGYGYGGGYMVGYQTAEAAGTRINNDKAGHGEVYRYEAGLQLNLTSWLSGVIAYNHFDMEFEGAQGGTSNADTGIDVVNAGVRLTF